MWAPEDLINKIKNQPELFIKKIHDLVGKDMKINAIVGNPPYQVMDGGGKGASSFSVYHLFVEICKLIKPDCFSMIMPARWFSGGKGMDEFREDMLNDKRISSLYDYFDSAEVFPNIDISGGICYFLWQKNYYGNCLITSVRAGKTNSLIRPLIEDTVVHSFIRFNESVSIVKKTFSKDSFESIVSVRKPFGDLRPENRKEKASDVFVFAYPENGFIPLNEIKINQTFVDQYKVFISKAYGERGSFPYFVLGKPFFGDKGTVCSETYLIVAPSFTKYECKAVIKYFETRFLRFLVLQKKNTQNAPKGVYSFVPMQDFTSDSDIDWSKSVPEIDRQLYAKYNLSDEEIAFIESMIKPMEK